MKYDKSKCKSPMFKGYTGCMCTYCEWFKNQRGEWKLSIKGNRFYGAEIAAVRENNRHGFASWGWFDKYKKCLFSFERWQGGVPLDMWNMQKELAKDYVKKLNEKENKK
jgi:hypothetical protein